MSVKSQTVLKFIAMVVAPFIFEFVLLDLEYSGKIQPDQNALLHLVFYSLMALSLLSFCADVRSAEGGMLLKKFHEKR